MLPNGVRLLLQPNHALPNLHFRLAFAGGSMFEPARVGELARTIQQFTLAKATITGEKS